MVLANFFKQFSVGNFENVNVSNQCFDYVQTRKDLVRNV